MAYGVINGLTGSYRISPARTKLPIDSIAPSDRIVSGATPSTFVVQSTGLYQIDLSINLSSPSRNVPFTIELFNVTANSVVQQRTGVIPGQAFPSDMCFGFNWNNLSVTDEYAFYITPETGIFYPDYAILISNLNFRAVIQELGWVPSNVVQAIIAAASDETTPLTIGANKVTFRMPFAFTLTGIRASVTVAPTGAALSVDVKQGGISILSTLITIDAGELTSVTAAVPPAILTSALADDAQMTVDVMAIGTIIAGAGLKVLLIGYKT